MEIELMAGHIEIYPRGVDVVIDHLDDGPVLRAPADVSTLTSADVRRLIDEDRIR